MWPNPTDETAISLQEVIESAKLEYSYQYLLWYWKEKATEGVFNMPAELATEEEFEVVNNEIDISDLDIMSRLPGDQWLANIGGLICDCNYVKSNINQAQLLKGDESLPEDYKPYIIIGKKIKFLKGTHSNKLSIIYANSGRDINGVVEVSNELGALVRRGLYEVYFGKVAQSDKTNNTNPNS